MAAELEKLASKLAAGGWWDAAHEIRDLRSRLLDLRQIPSSVEELIKLDKEWKHQTEDLVDAGFAEELGVADYVTSLPPFIPDSSPLDGRLTENPRPIIVDPRVSLKRQCELLDIRYRLGDKEVYHWSKDKDPFVGGPYAILNEPYTTWIGATDYKSSTEARRNVKGGRRPANIFDGLAQFRGGHRRPLEVDVFVFPGTELGRLGSDYTVALRVDREGYTALIPQKVSHRRPTPHATVFECWGPVKR